MVSFSVNSAQLEIVETYIKNQEAHHRKKDFQEEYRSILTNYKMDYDERYLWD
ncbi:hypothetical protein ADICEAN_03575 [Cesiribacter andamanensis AMV16]|uniref:Transposase n=1 Tax=Cesiribacter andamanensis AMV16 TaxID=1279009 RepID=M7NS70_9BACT|nr:hypothetical protein ADICEAN_03575 [Cesiribacter andamanensis AMV16]